jgi:hypothetical protein
VVLAAIERKVSHVEVTFIDHCNTHLVERLVEEAGWLAGWALTARVVPLCQFMKLVMYTQGMYLLISLTYRDRRLSSGCPRELQGVLSTAAAALVDEREL